MNFKEIYKRFKELELEEDDIITEDTEQSEELSTTLLDLPYTNISIGIEQVEDNKNEYYLIIYVSCEDMIDDEDTNNFYSIIKLFTLPHYIEYDGDNEIFKFPLGDKSTTQEKIKEINEKIKSL